MRYHAVLIDHETRCHYSVEDATVARAVLKGLRLLIKNNPEFLGPVMIKSRNGDDDDNPMHSMSDHEIGEYLADQLQEQHVVQFFCMIKYDDKHYGDPCNMRENPDEPRMLCHIDKSEEQMYLPCGFITPKLS